MKTLTTKQLLEVQKDFALNVEYKDNGEQTKETRADLYDSEFIESGKLNSNTAYEIRSGKGFFNSILSGIPIVIKINIATQDNDNTIKKEVGRTFQQRSKKETKEDLIQRAKEWISNERDRRIKHNNRAKKTGTKPSVYINKFLSETP